MPFYFKINKVKITDNRESGFLFFSRDLAEIKLESFFASSNSLSVNLEKYHRSAKNDQAKDEAVAELISGIVNSRTSIRIESVRDNQTLTFGDTGYAIYRAENIPEDVSWCLMAIEDDQNIRDVGDTIEQVMQNPGFNDFTKHFASLVGASANPSFTASVAIIRFIGQCVSIAMKKNKDDMVGLLYMSLNRREHYPNGERKSDGVMDLTGNMSIDYSVFGFEDLPIKCLPKHLP
jgi:hypothetical protein